VPSQLADPHLVGKEEEEERAETAIHFKLGLKGFKPQKINIWTEACIKHELT